jgi:hypothetical protein
MKEKLQPQKTLKRIYLAITVEPVIPIYPRYVPIAEKNPVTLFAIFNLNKEKKANFK